MLLMTALVLVTWIAIGFDYYDRNYSGPWTDPDKLERIPSRIFKNETVVLDGKFFLQPTFDHVTFIYNGTAPFAFDNAHFMKPPDGEVAFNIVSQNKIAREIIKLENAVFNSVGCRGWTEVRRSEDVQGIVPTK
jgi:hypothetical protein